MDLLTLSAEYSSPIKSEKDTEEVIQTSPSRININATEEVSAEAIKSN